MRACEMSDHGVDNHGRQRDTHERGHDRAYNRYDEARAHGPAVAFQIAGADALRRNDRHAAEKSENRKSHGRKNSRRARHAGQRNRSETSDRNSVDHAQQLIAEHRESDRKRKAPDRGAHVPMVDEHSALGHKASSASKNAPISSSVV